MRRLAGLCAAVLALPSLCGAIACPGGTTWVNTAGGQRCVQDRLPALIKTLKQQQTAAQGTLMYPILASMISGLEARQRQGAVIDEHGKWVVPKGQETPPPLPPDVEKALAKKDDPKPEPKPEPKPANTPSETPPPPPEQTRPEEPVVVLDRTTTEDLQRWEQKADAPNPAASKDPGEQPAPGGADQNLGASPGGADASGTGGATSGAASGGTGVGSAHTKAADLGGPDSTTAKAGNASSIKSLGSRLKNAFNDAGKAGAGDLAAAGAKMGALGTARPGAAGAPGSSPPSLTSPRTPQEFVLAAGPYKQSFAQAGLRAAVGPHGEPLVLRKDGSPASPAELTALGAAIQREPSALARNPNFLDPARGGISRESFGGLKTAYREKPELHDTEFKHIALEEERDFKRSQACDKVSGDCNTHAAKSYAKGDDVPPEELRSIWDDVEKYAEKVEKDLQARITGSRTEKAVGRGSTFRALIDSLAGGRAENGERAPGLLVKAWRRFHGGSGHARTQAGGGDEPTQERKRGAPEGPTNAPEAPEGPRGRGAAPVAAVLGALAAAAGGFLLRRKGRAAATEKP